MLLDDSPVVEVPETRDPTNDTIPTAEQRRKRYRAKLVEHQKEKRLRLKHFLQQKRRYFRSLDLLPRRKRAEDTDLMCRYFNGDQYGAYDELGVYFDDRQEGDFAYAIPVLSGHVEQAFLQLLKVKPQYTVTADDKDDATMNLVAAMCEELGSKELMRVTEATVHSELYNMLLGGESYRILGWEPNKVSPKMAKRPKYEKKEIDLAARRECASPQCSATIPENASTCPNCGNTEFREIAGGKSTIYNHVGFNEIPLGENTLRVPHMLACQRDMSAIEPDDSTFLIEYSYIDKHVAEWEYQSEIEPSDLGLPIEMLLRFDLERGSTQVDALIGTSRLTAPSREGSYGAGMSAVAAAARKQPQERHYWEPSQYGQFYCDVEEQLPNGKKIPAGSLLGDYFPDGAFVLFVGDSVMEFDHCIRRRKVTLVRYGRIAGTNSGAGLKKIMPLQDAENDNFNLNQTVKHTVGHPLTVINGHHVSELPGAGNVLKITRAGVDDIGKVVKQYPGQAVNNADGVQQVIDGAMQFIAGTNTVGGTGLVGAPDMKAAGTATGIAAMQEQAAGRQSGPVDQRIKADKELLVQLLENIQDYSTKEQWEELAKRYGGDVVKRFKATNLRQSVTVGIKSNSDMPRSMALTQANYLAFGQAAAQVLPVAIDHPWIMEFLADLATSMGFPFTIGQGRNDRREAEYRLNVLLEIEKELARTNSELLTNDAALAAAMHAELAKRCDPMIVTDESNIDPTAPPDEQIPRIFLQVHESFQDVYKDALFSERAKAWSKAYTLVVIQLWIDHYKAAMSQTAVRTTLEAAANAAMNPEPPANTGPSPEELAALEEQKENAKFEREAKLKTIEHQHSEEAADSQLERDIVMEQTEAENDQDIEQMRLAAAKARRPAPSASTSNGN